MMKGTANMTKTYTCLHCHTKSEKIGVVSEATQTLTIASDDWNDTEVGATLSGYCLTCNTPIPEEILEKLTGAPVIEDFLRLPGRVMAELLRSVVDDYETSGCDGCGTVSTRVINMVRKALGLERV
jgi:hypothetical protein